ncbi:unnamed protein product [Urochloa humidicola]
MAPSPSLAPGERPGDATAAPPDPPPAAPTAPTTASGAPPASATPTSKPYSQPAAKPHRSTATRPATSSSSPAPHARPRLKARRDDGAPQRSKHTCSGGALQDSLLADYHATAVPGAIAPNTPVSIWITPLSRTKRYSLVFVRNMVNHTLTTRPDRLEVNHDGLGVFRVLVSCRRVAVALAVRGYLRMGSSCLIVHLSRAAAAAATITAEKRDDFTAAHRPKLPANGTSLQQHPASGSNATFTAAQSSNGKISQDSPQAVATTPDVSPPEGATTCQATNGADRPDVTPGVNATKKPAAPYLRALLTPSKPQKTLPPRPPPITALNRCFRCLAADHKVAACRDPVCCRNCRGTGHRTPRCPMPIARVLTPMPRRRRPTVPNPSQRATVNAVPYSPRSSSPPPPPTSPPPPTPEHLHAALAAAYDPLCLIPSSSSGEPDFKLPRKSATAVDRLKAGTSIPRAARAPPARETQEQKEEERAPPGRHVFPRSVDIHVVSNSGKAPVNTATMSDSSTSAGRRSPPPTASPPVLRAPLANAATQAGGANDSVASEDGAAWNGDSDIPSDEEEVESGDVSTGSDGTPSNDGSDLADWEGRRDSLEVWLPRGRVDVAARLTFAYVHPSEVSVNAAPFIRAAISSVAPHVSVELLPSSRGTMLLRFATQADREHVRSFSPIHHAGGELKLERPQETNNRFFRAPDWLAYVAVVDYPPEHWDDIEHIKRSFCGFCNVVEIDPLCLTGFDYSPLRLVLEVTHRLEIPSEIWVDAEQTELGGSIAQIMPIRIWPRSDQLGPDGQLLPFFAPPPPPPHPPMHHNPLGLASPALPPPPFAPAPPQQPHPPYAFGPYHGYLLHLAALLACTKLSPACTAAIVPPPPPCARA